MNYGEAKTLAGEIVTQLKPYVSRIEIAGSVRREKQDQIKDIEIVCKPNISTFPSAEIDLFGNPLGEQQVNYLEQYLQDQIHPPMQWNEKSVWALGDRRADGKMAAPFSEKYYAVKYKGQKLDIFCVTGVSSWGVDFTLRTGGWEFNKSLVVQGWRDGLHFEGGKMIQYVWADSGKPIPEGSGPVDVSKYKVVIRETPEEQDVFSVLGLKFIEPKERSLREKETQEDAKRRWWVK